VQVRGESRRYLAHLPWSADNERHAGALASPTDQPDHNPLQLQVRASD